jgi:UDP-N-acetylglucosamine 2-epimerase (non-hydrolysing)
VKKFIIIVGTRPEAIKLIPVFLQLKRNPLFETILVSTGQHKEMLRQIFSFFEVSPNYDLSLMKANQTLSEITSLLFLHIDEIIKKLSPDLVIVQGDTTTAMVASMTAFYNRVQVAHVEAGLRTFDKYAPFPEEANRRIVSQLADIHFTPTDGAQKNLEMESIKNAFMVGNTVIDSLLLGKKKVYNNLKHYKNKFSYLLSEGRKIILITAHRRESFGEGLKNICSAIEQLSRSNPDCDFVFPVHLNPNIQSQVFQLLKDIKNVYLISPLQYDDMIFLLTQTHLILTDSGGIQEEAPALNIPLIVLRDVTERPEGIEAGCALLAGTDVNKIIEIFNKIYFNNSIYAKMQNAINPYGDGGTSIRIESILEKWFC